MVLNQKVGRLDGIELRSDGAERTMQLVRALPRTFETVSFRAADSPLIFDFRGLQGFNSIQGWITNDGAGDILVSFSRDGTTFGDKWTMRSGENTNLIGFDIARIRVEHTGQNSAFRIFLI